ncbi:MAG: hypothetical protein KAH32_05870 [Chlamydiia bacterium]|nr:hypothetical protein [Chlamydiia bacterium]
MKGLLTSKRDIGKIAFLKVRTIFGDIDITVKDKEYLKSLKNVHLGSYIEFLGDIEEKEHGKKSIETLSLLKPLNITFEKPPLEYESLDDQYKLDFLLDNRSASVRMRRSVQLAKISSFIVLSYTEYMKSIGATYILTPHLTTYGIEGGADLFPVEYFGSTAFLSQSAQMYKQIMVGAIPRVFSISPCFRAEKSSTTRHLSEIHQLEYESHMIEGDDVLKISIEFIEKVVTGLKDQGLAGDISESVYEITFEQAKDLSKKEGIISKDDDLSTEEEKFIGAYINENFGKDIVAITKWPKAARPFYSFSDENGITNTFDILIKGTEVCSGGQRINKYEDLIRSMKENEIEPKSMGFYEEAFRYGMPEHGGFGFGIERLVYAIVGSENIRECVLFPSDMKRVGGRKIELPVIFGGDDIRSFAKSMSKTAWVEGISGDLVKSIILKDKKNNVFMLVLPIDDKIDFKKLRDTCGKVEFAPKDFIEEKFGLVVGDVPPYGCLAGIETFLSVRISSFERISFSTGRIGEHATMKIVDFEKNFQFQYCEC